MTLKVIVFDFDGTLIDSNRLKYDAFFKLFPDGAHHASTVREVLDQIGEASRYEIIEKILAGLGRRPTDLQGDVNALADRYNTIVLDGAKKCPQMPGAGPLLADIGNAAASAARAWRTGETAQILAATAAYAAALDRLDAAAKLGIVTAEHRSLAQLSQREAAVYKTSGAGGGDLGFALTDQAVVASRLRDAFAAAGYRVLPLKIAAPGLTVSA